MAADEILVERVRAALSDETAVREVKMFGGLSFMVNDRMVVCASNGGDLLVRVAPEDHEKYAAWEGAAQAEMGKGRSMGDGWITVSVDALDDDKRLHRWIQVSLEHNRAATTKKG